MARRFFWFEDGIRLVEAPLKSPELLGQEVVAANGVPVADLLVRLRRFMGAGETETGMRAGLPYLMARGDLVEAVGAGEAGVFKLTLKDRNGALIEASLPVSGPKGVLGQKSPMWERPADKAFSWRWLSPQATYVNWRGYENLDEESAALLTEIDARQPRKVIIDLRDNGGGDYNVGRRFISALAERDRVNRDGALYVLTGGDTFSAAMTNAVDFRTSTKAILVGEAPGARPNNWQESRRFFLPNSGLPVSVSTKYYASLLGDGASLEPDIMAPPKVEDWGRDIDSAVALILARP